jgi:two-component system sensor histidine kinase KdpD
VAAVLIGVVGFPLVTLALTAAGGHADLSTALSSYLVLVVAVAATGGVWPASLAALAGFLLSNYYFAPPVHTFTIADARDILALVMFLVVAGAVSVLVDLSARTTATAIRARSEARMLARVAGRMVAPEGNPLPALLEELLVAFRLEAAAVLRSQGARPHPGSDHPPGGRWSTVAGAGRQPPGDPGDATMVLPLTDRDLLALRGPGLTAEDRDILAAFAAQLSTALESDRLHAEAAGAEALARANQLRSALLAAVSHDLRTPLASIKAASSSLLSEQLVFGPEETSILLQTIDDESDRLNSLVENLLDMSRLQTGSMDVARHSTDVGEVIDAAIESLGPRGETVVLEAGGPLPRIHTDPVLLERAVANLIDNSLLHAEGAGLRVEAGAVADRVDIRVIDRGPGIGPADRDRVFQPFQRLGDSASGRGVGLGLAVARGFVEAVGGELEVDDTPGGGCTMVVRIPQDVGDGKDAARTEGARAGGDVERTPSPEGAGS